MDRESTPEATPEHVEDTTHGTAEDARQELRELKRMLLLSKLRETKDTARPEPKADEPTRGRTPRAQNDEFPNDEGRINDEARILNARIGLSLTPTLSPRERE